MGIDPDKKTLLIVDDVELFIQLQISHLGRKRFDIHTANSGEQGLQMARSLKPDLILLDLLMPGMNGDEACRSLKDDPETSSIPVVLVSSGTRDVSRSIIEASGCDGLIFKPVRRDLLLSVVESLLKTNKRSFDRVSASIPCIVTVEEKKHHGTIHSLSSEGAFVEIDLNMVRGDLMEMKFTLPVLEMNVNVRAGAVIWCGSLKESGPRGAGVQFLTVSQESRRQISVFVQMKLGGERVPGQVE